MTLQEILKEYGFSKMPKGTTEAQWIEYHKDMINHEKVYGEKLRKGECSSMDYHCFMPNRPGYYRANND